MAKRRRRGSPKQRVKANNAPIFVCAVLAIMVLVGGGLFILKGNPKSAGSKEAILENNLNGKTGLAKEQRIDELNAAMVAERLKTGVSIEVTKADIKALLKANRPRAKAVLEMKERVRTLGNAMKASKRAMSKAFNGCYDYTLATQHPPGDVIIKDILTKEMAVDASLKKVDELMKGK